MLYQPFYFPWIGFFDMVDQCDILVFYDDAQYSKGTWQNRNRIKTSHGPQWISVPVRRVATEQRIADTLVDARGWQRRHLKSLELNYRRAPYFDVVYPLIRGVL